MCQQYPDKCVFIDRIYFYLLSRLCQLTFGYSVNL